jgi:hypothetical protein
MGSTCERLYALAGVRQETLNGRLRAGAPGHDFGEKRDS